MNCPLCLSPEAKLFDIEKTRTYFQCQSCQLVYVPRSELISLEDEKKRYEAHENYGPHYEEYLNSIVQSILPYLKEGMQGLDFGSGRSRYLPQILREKKIETASFDTFFYPSEEVFEKKYDFILMSEVIEHLRAPSPELMKIKKCLAPHGHLFVKTKFLPQSNFGDWFYKRDRTHVQFFSPPSFKHLSQEFGFKEFETIGEDLYLFRNKS